MQYVVLNVIDLFKAHFQPIVSDQLFQRRQGKVLHILRVRVLDEIEQKLQVAHVVSELLERLVGVLPVLRRHICCRSSIQGLAVLLENVELLEHVVRLL